MTRTIRTPDFVLELNEDDVAEAILGAVDKAMFEAGRIVKGQAEANVQHISQGITERMYVISKGHEEGRPHKVSRRKVQQEGGAVVSSSDPKTHLFELGVDAHPIKPRRKKVLRFADGTFVRGEVQHPGMVARPFLRPALDETKQQAAEAAAKSIREDIKS